MRYPLKTKTASRRIVTSLLAMLLLPAACGGGDDDEAGAPDSGPLSTPIGPITDVSGDADEVSEARPIGSTVGLTLEAVDVNAVDTVTYALSDDADGRFAIDAATGVVTLATRVDFESATSHEVSVTADSSDGSSSSAMFSINIVDNQAPTVEVLFPVDGNFGGAQLTAFGNVSDPEGEVTTVTISTSAGEVTAVVDDLGQWVAEDLNFEGDLNPVLTISVVDASGELGEDVEVGLHRSDMLAIPRRLEMNFATQIGYLTDNARLLKFDIAQQEITIVSGSGVGTGTSLGGAIGLAVDEQGGVAYVAEVFSGRIFSIDLLTGNRTILTSDSVGTGLEMTRVFDVILDTPNDRLYVLNGGRIVTVALDTGDRTILADVANFPGQGAGGRAMTINAARDTLYYIGTSAAPGRILNTTISAVDIETGTISLIADDSLGAGDDFENTDDIVLDEANNRFLVPNPKAREILAVDLATGDRTVFIDGETGSGVKIDEAFGLTFDPATGTTYVVDLIVDSIFSISAALVRERVITSSVGAGEHMRDPRGSVLDAANRRLFVCATESTEISPFNSTFEGEIYAVDLNTGDRTLITGSDVGTGPVLERPQHIAFVPMSGTIYLSDIELRAIVAVDVATGDRTMVASADVGTGADMTFVNALVVAPGEQKIWMMTGSSELLEVDIATGDRVVLAGPATDAFLGTVAATSMVFDETNNRLLIASSVSNAGIFAVDMTSFVTTVIADDAIGLGPNFPSAKAIAYETSTDTIFLAAQTGKAVFRVDAATGDRERLSGPVDGSGFKLESPTHIVQDPSTGNLLVVDGENSGIVSVDARFGARITVSR